MVACTNHKLIDAAKTLIQLGANVNSYRPGNFIAKSYVSNAALGFVVVLSITGPIFRVELNQVLLMFPSCVCVFVNVCFDC